MSAGHDASGHLHVSPESKAPYAVASIDPVMGGVDR